MDFEVFIQVFNSNYYISNFGRVYNSKSKMITLSPEGKGKYARVKMTVIVTITGLIILDGLLLQKIIDIYQKPLKTTVSLLRLI